MRADLPEFVVGPRNSLSSRLGGGPAVVSYAPYFEAVAKLLRDVAALALAAAIHKSSRSRLLAVVESLVQHQTTWRLTDSNHKRYAARFRVDREHHEIPDLAQGIGWAQELLQGDVRLKVDHAARDVRIAGLLALERCVRGAAALEATQEGIGWRGDMAWTRFERRGEWQFEVGVRHEGSEWSTAAQGSNLVQTARDAGHSALCSRPWTAWSFAQFKRVALLVPVRRGDGVVLLDEVRRAVAGQSGAAGIAEELQRHRRAGGAVAHHTFDQILRDHLRRCEVSDVEVILLEGLRPIVLYVGGVSREGLEDALRSVMASIGAGD
ncbi:hypothetical protein [Achromobacter sp. DH1f]|uniref:hypothetical protein n=1 Tax=Achromobacter sp. DH1f TaxID=1397275 RepID=UPI000469F733|nr:hypothetical protein [Achromobacter sp. DH1f]